MAEPNNNTAAPAAAPAPAAPAPAAVNASDSDDDLISLGTQVRAAPRPAGSPTANTISSTPVVSAADNPDYGHLRQSTNPHAVTLGSRKYFDSADKPVMGTESESKRVVSIVRKRAKIAPSHSGRKKVLLVEDVRVSQRIARVALTKARYSVDLAGDGEEAVSKYTKGDYAIVLMDINLPKLDGHEATKRIRAVQNEKKRKEILIIGLTSVVLNDEMIGKCKEAGMDGCIAKGSVLVPALERAIQDHLANPSEFVVTQIAHI
jgi:CheY-like chemotaxis protein